MKEKISLKGSVVLNPVPVVLITSRNKEGKDNVFTVGWIGTVCTKPPMLSISIRPERLSYEYIKESMEFTVNLPHSKMTREVDYCGVRSGRVEDKISAMNFNMKEGTHVTSPYIDDCPVAIECKVKNILPLGTHDVFIAEVLGSHVDSSLFDEKGKIHFEKADLITYAHGEYYKMDTEAIGKFGYSVAKKPATAKNPTKKATNSKKTDTSASRDNGKGKKEESKPKKFKSSTKSKSRKKSSSTSNNKVRTRK